LTRDEFQPARSLNLLAAAWIQFEVHDWFSHGENEKTKPYQVPLSPGDPWPDKPMEIPRTMADRSRPADSSGPPAYINTATHWWDGSQVYGNDRETETRLRNCASNDPDNPGQKFYFNTDTNAELASAFGIIRDSLPRNMYLSK
jgi:hypothetical protein